MFRGACHPSVLVSSSSCVLLLLVVGGVGALEVSTGKVSTVEAINGSTVLLPCTYSSCIGIKNLYFNWHYDDNGTMLKLCEAVIPMEGVEPKVSVFHERVEFVGSSKSNNISILLWNITFEDQGAYLCFARNEKEKFRNHTAVFTLLVVDQIKELDKSLTVIIVSVLGAVIGFSIIFMVIKGLVVHFLLSGDEKTKECLVSSGIDNTENGVSGARADSKAPPKA
ncbi:LOW QUALITY PROTEIN: sodium channel subunit beta-4-like [Pseudoliparis swirei]|uniref:LOW QUALITY PROTEIN: sodium channel subunit beta-4-like n=1 Tax=Pseudoliparis swirei TaxID=2059687 RepID=UPI0024BEEA66|nr:LOW QUALITY PROTEIN: sodium channel subunit beta-4-like [Pseudoliparis swirei]